MLYVFYLPSSSADICLDGEEGFFCLQENKVIEEITALLKKKSQNDTGQNYKLGKTERFDLYTFSIFPCFYFKC